MAVVVADTLTQKNGLDFPLMDGNDLKGGLHCLSTADDLTTLLASEKLATGMLVFVADADGEGNSTTYQINASGEAEVFSGALTEAMLQAILEYVAANLDTGSGGTLTEATEEDGVDYILTF